MKISFSLSYQAQWGQRIVIALNGKNYDMVCVDGYLWAAEIDGQPAKGDYCYKLLSGESVIREEAAPHSYQTTPAVKNLIIKDKWNDISANAPFKTAFFKNVVFRRQGVKAKATTGPVTLRVCAPSLRPWESLGVTGSFCGWGKPVMLDETEFPLWTVKLALEGPVEYKFVIVSSRPGEPMIWETGENRVLWADTASKGTKVIVNENEPNFDKAPWRGAGLAVPVFSLRTEDDFGVGEFLDLKKMVDWACETGQNVIQLLPINDTTMSGTWQDSYPYNANTTFALHPQFVNLQKAGVKVDKKFKALQKELNALPKIDYQKVNGEKARLMRETYLAEAGKKTLASKDYKDFVKENESWLLPYSVFCCLRDVYGTPDFSAWGKMAKYSATAVRKWANEHKEDVEFNYFVQYHLDRQLKDVVAYAHSKGVALKGDLPIGISRTSVDAWAYPQLYHLDSQAGAPPDAFSTLGQNWGFPTYNWEKMSEDGFAWWKARMHKMSEYFDAFRIDHILGFFRIWEIPMDAVHGLLGHFNPALPYSSEELAARGFAVGEGKLTTPPLYQWVLEEIFGTRAEEVYRKYIKAGKLAKEVSTQRAVLENVKDEELQKGLLTLLDDVLFIEDPRKKGYWHPRISGQDTITFRCLEEHLQREFLSLHEDFYYHRHNDFWRQSAMFKLPSILSSTGMLTCGEDLGMIPACVPSVMDELGILSLEIQRMPKSIEEEFANPAAYPYRCVCATGTHDTSNIRAWWEEDREVTAKFWHGMLGRTDDMPWFCEPWVAELIVKQHLESPAMLCILPLQDYFAIDGEVRYGGDPADERINVPAIPRFYWRYRMHVSIEELLANKEYTAHLAELIHSARRG